MSTRAIGVDWTLEVADLRDAATGSYLNSASITYSLFATATGAAVAGGTGTLSYVAASNGTYRGTVESTVTSTLSAGEYFALCVVNQSAYDTTLRIDIVAVAPGQAIIDPDTWFALTGITVTGTDALTISRLCASVSEALTRRCYPKLLVPKTLTLFALDAPTKNVLCLPALPVRSITALHLAYGANGDSSALDATTLLTPFVDYVLDIDDALTGWSRSGRVFRRRASGWGHENQRSIGRLAGEISPYRKCVFVSGEFGPATVNPVAQEVASSIVTQLFERRKRGAPVQSESWNGASYSLAGPFTAEAAVNSPDVLGLLRDAGLLPGIHVGGS